MGMARGDLRPCYSLRAAGVHSPAFPVVADGAKDVVAAPMVLAPGADRQRPDHGLRLRPGVVAAKAWLPGSRTRHIGVGVDTAGNAGMDAIVEQPIIHRLNPQVP